MEVTPKNARQWSRFGPRATYGLTILDLIERNERVYALSADLGASSGLQRVMNSSPNRFLNVGIAEQNLIGVAAGLAKEGLIPFASSFAPFITFRCADQIRMNMGYMHLNIKTVGLSSGISTGGFGNSHYGLEDVALMQAIPEITILSPADCSELVKMIEAAANYTGPVYIRLTGEPGMPIVYQDEFDYTIGKALLLREGDDIALVATGSMVSVALEVSQKLKDSGIESAVIDMHTIKPLDEQILETVSQRVKLVITLEEHSIIGGLGSAVARYLSCRGNAPKLMTVGLPDSYLQSGDYKYMLEKYGLTANAVAERIKKEWSNHADPISGGTDSGGEKQAND